MIQTNSANAATSQQLNGSCFGCIPIKPGVIIIIIIELIQAIQSLIPIQMFQEYSFGFGFGFVLDMIGIQTGFGRILGKDNYYIVYYHYGILCFILVILGSIGLFGNDRDCYKGFRIIYNIKSWIMAFLVGFCLGWFIGLGARGQPHCFKYGSIAFAILLLQNIFTQAVNKYLLIGFGEI